MWSANSQDPWRLYERVAAFERILGAKTPCPCTACKLQMAEMFEVLVGLLGFVRWGARRANLFVMVFQFKS